MNFVKNSKFNLGKIVITPGAISALAKSNQDPKTFLERHQSGDWGDLCDEDKQSNDEAVANEGQPEKQQRVMSVYSVNETKLWIISEWDRSVTTLLLPDEY